MRWGCLFLNNRYHDPTLGTFISVDPLVAATGTPYLYASGNPTTLADPSGLCAEGQGGCGIDFDGSGVRHTSAFNSFTRTSHGDVVGVTQWYQWGDGWEQLDVTDPWVRDEGGARAKAINSHLHDCAGGDSDGECARLAILLGGGSIDDAYANWGAFCGSIAGLCYTAGSARATPAAVEVLQYASVILPVLRGGLWIQGARAAAAAGTTAEYGVGELGGALGVTDAVTGDITVQAGLSGHVLEETIRHELVHQYIVRGTVTGPVSRFFYGRSALATFSEEAFAESIATGSVSQGVSLASGYITLNGAVFDGAVVAGVYIAGKAAG